MALAVQIRKIHALKNILNIDDDLYREILIKNFNVQSSKNLSVEEADMLITDFENKAIALNKWTRKRLKYEELSRDNKMATPAQLRMIEGMWKDVCYFDSKELFKTSLRHFIRNKYKYDDIMFLTKAGAKKVIEGIKGIKRNIEKSAVEYKAEI